MTTTQAVARLDPQALITKAVESGAGVDVLERLVALAKDVREVQAREAWHEAMAEFHKVCPSIKKTKKAKITTSGGGSYGYSFAPLNEMMEITRPIMGDLGLSVSWSSRCEPTRVVVTCRIAHALGYAETSGEVSMPIGDASDRTGATPAQKVGIALTYARRYSFIAIAGLAPDEDSDGAGQKEPRQEPMSKAQAAAAPTTTARVVTPEVMPSDDPLRDLPIDATLEEEARAREQSEAKGPIPPVVDRSKVWGKVMQKAKADKTTTQLVINNLTRGEFQNMPDMSDADVAALDKKLEGK